MAKSIMEPKGSRTCFACGAAGYVEEHHIFHGTANRKRSEAAGLKVHLCHRCHRQSGTGVHGGNRGLDIRLKQEAQKTYERTHTRKEFMELIGKNYLDAGQERRIDG